MQKIVAVKLRESGQNTYFIFQDLTLKIGDWVIVEADRGLDYGQINAEPEDLSGHKHDESVKKIIRLANEDDLKKIEENRIKAKEAYHSCASKISEHKLDMKLVGAEYSFDRSKIIFYFTAEGRVDFRNLVKDLARVFKARIELRQIGVRDEAKLLGGFGPCGRELCCAKFLKDFEPVTIKMAKEQNLPLNPPKLSGLCGRLMCCLAYECQTYKELCKELPKEGEKIITPQGKGKVLSVNALKKSVVVELEDARIITINYEGNKENK